MANTSTGGKPKASAAKPAPKTPKTAKPKGKAGK